MPKGISRGKAKSGLISYDVDSLANRFGVLYPEFKDDIKQNIVDYGDFLPETFFKEVGTPKVQDIIGVSILGEMKNNPEMMAVANEYMSEYMSGPVREINKITGKKNRYTKKLSNPPAYKPKKKKQSKFQSALAQAQQNR